MKQVDANENSELVGVDSGRTGAQDGQDASGADGESPERAAAPSSVQRAPAGRMSTYHRLIEACKLKELATIGSILAERPELANQRDKHNRTLLHYAAILLIDDASVPASGVADPKQQSRQQSQRRPTHANNRNQLQQRQLSGAENSIECFNYLTDRCDLKLWWQQDLDGLSILHLAVISSNVPLVKHIIYEHPYSIKYPLVCTLDNELHSPLHWAVITNNLDCVSLLIGYAGAKLAHESDLNGATPLHYATQTSDYPKYRQQLRVMLRSVGQHQDSRWKQDGSNRAAKQQPGGPFDSSSDHQAAAAASKPADASSCSSTAGAPGAHQRGLEILEYLARLPQIDLECKDRDRRTPLLWAASSGNRDAIMLLVSNGADVGSHDINRLGALHCAASHGYTDCLECLLALGNRTGGAAQFVNQPDNLSCTPLFYAVLSGNIDCVEALLERGAKQDWQDTKGRTAAHFAALKGQLNSLKLMHERGANLWLPNKQGDLPLHYAIKSGRQQVVRWLLEHSPYERAVNAINNYGRAPIHLAIQKDNLALAEYLVRCGANLNQLVKVRDRAGNAASRNQTAVAGPRLENGSEVHQTKGGGQYHYETALDMAHNLGHKQCLRLLADHQALPAAQVIRNRSGGQSASFPPTAAPMGNVRSLFDLQSVDGPSPIGFETSCSSVSPSANRALAGSSGQRIPKLTRPQPDSLPQTDSTGSSALSQNSLTSVRGQQQPQQQPQPQPQPQQRQQYYGKPLSKQQRQLAGLSIDESTVANEPPTIATTSMAATGATGVLLPTTAEQAAGADHEATAARQGGAHRSKRPYRGGISYNNELINASIKCKVYGGGGGDHAAGKAHANHRSFPQEGAAGSAGGGPARRSVPAGRSARSAPIGGGGRGGAHRDVGVGGGGGQEIITHVNVYTSPCPHCVHHKLEQCVQCSSDSQRKLEHRQAASPRSTGPRQQSALYSDETSDATTESEDIERSLDGHYLPSLTQQQRRQQQRQQVQMRGSHSQAQTSQSASSFARDQQQRHFQAPAGQRAQQAEQHLPVILSDREQSLASRSPDDDQLEQQQREQEQREAEQQEARKAGGAISSAGEEPRFDRSERSRASRRVDRYRDHVRSPVAEYIHGLGYSSPTRDQQQYREQAAGSRPASLNRALDGRASKPHWAASHRLSDYSQVKSKVDSHREPGDEHMRSKSMSTLPTSTQLPQLAHHQHIQRREQHHHQRSPLAPGSPQRSCSRQTIIRTRRLSVDSVELASSVEKSIRKYKQETKLFEELQNLKRSQIRSGRANEALLVKRLIEHFRQDSQLDLIGLDVYHGPYTYKSYERFLYDQLRKLSHSNCAKLGRHFRQLADQFDGYLDDDLRADLELRRVIDGATEESDEAPDESYVLEPSGALEEIRVRRSRTQTDPALSAADLDADQADGGREGGAAKREQLGREIQRELIHRASVHGDELSKSTRHQKTEDRALEDGEQHEKQRQPQSNSSAASSRRSSVEVEREKLLGLPLRVQSKEEPEEKEQVEEEEEEEEEEADADERTAAPAGNIEDEAQSLSSSILVDALGNVSRSGSPTLLPLDSSRAGAKSQVTSAKQIEKEQAEADADADADEEPSSPPPTQMGAAGRRRSVVNIGNKMEVIYHDVAIEINPAADSDHESLAASEQDQQQQQQQQQQQEPSAELSSGRDRLEDVEELEEDRASLIWRADLDAEQSAASEARADDDGERRAQAALEEAVVAEQDEEAPQATGGGGEEADEAPTGEPAGTTRRRESSTPHEDLEGLASAGSSGVGSSDSLLLARTRSEASNRRASSPLVVRPAASTVGEPARSQRSNSVSRTEPGEGRRVFTGYDLDEMRRSRLRRTPTPVAETLAEDEAVGKAPTSERATEARADEAADDQEAESARGQPEERAATSAAATRDAGEEEEEAEELPGARKQPAKQAKRKLVSPTRRRLEPSRPPPRGAYKLRVPIDEVKERWAQVKAEQRDKGRRARKPALIKGGQRRATSLELADEGAASLTKSQPSLRLADAETPTPADCYPNYTLLYEINKGARLYAGVKSKSAGTAPTAGQQSVDESQAAELSTEQQHRSADQARSDFWCHRRAVKIVDVRTLKRTLSLPESLIYSNDLLKRFNILKL